MLQSVSKLGKEWWWEKLPKTELKEVVDFHIVQFLTYPFNVFVLSSFSIKRKHSWKTLISGLAKTPHTDSLGIEKPVSETFLNVKIALAEYRDFKIFI